MDYLQLLESITPEVYQNLCRAVELGKWPNGETLTREQKEQSLQAIIAYDSRNHSEVQRVGYIDKGKKTADACDDPAQVSIDALKWRD
jgi:uncharacterized protein